MFVIYWFEQDCDDVEHAILAVSETLDGAQQYKQKLLDDSVVNKASNEKLGDDYNKKLSQQRDDFALKIKAFLIDNLDALKVRGNITIGQRIDELAGINHRRTSGHYQGRFINKASDYWDRHLFLNEHFDSSKLKRSIEFINDDYIPFPTDGWKPVYNDSQILIVEVPLV